MSLALLRESKVGSTVSKLKKHANERVSNSAKALVKKWKKVAEASGVQGGAKVEKAASPKEAEPTEPDKGGGVGGAGAGAGSGAAAASPPPLKGALDGKLSAEVEIEDALTEVGIAPFRLKMRRKVFDTLTLDFKDGDRLPVARVAKEVECAMDDNNPYLRKKDGYLAKVRQLAFNLKKNEQLRQDVREGLVAPERLVVMTSTELMSKDKREAMDKAVSDRTEARMLDWYDKNKDKINKQCGITEQEGMFECGRCKSTKTTYTQKQTRSADEPMTTFVTCGNCKNRWKFC
ncbi:unnamed protein product [Laminaria digitata]